MVLFGSFSPGLFPGESDFLDSQQSSSVFLLSGQLARRQMTQSEEKLHGAPGDTK